MIILIVICCILYFAFGLFCYLTMFDSNTGGLITSYYPQSNLRISAEFVLMMMILTSIPYKQQKQYLYFIFVFDINKIE